MAPEDYVSYPLALALKKAGFDEPCQMYYTHEDAPDGAVWLTGDPRFPLDYNAPQEDDCPFARPICSAPSLYHAQKWLREKKGIAVSVQASEIQGELWYSADIITTKGINELVDGGFDYMAYEAGIAAGIAAALELIEKKGA